MRSAALVYGSAFSAALVGIIWGDMLTATGAAFTYLAAHANMSHALRTR